MKYLIYLRVSTKEQDEETQLDHCLKFIKQKENGEFKYEVFQDKITSKKPLFVKKKDENGDWIYTREIKRMGAKQLFNRMKKGDVIVAMRIDRMARTVYETTLLIDILEKMDCEILLVCQPGIKNKIMLGVYAGMAEEEVKTLRARVQEKLTSKKNRGERYSRFLPYGYGMHETKLVPIRDGEEIVMKRGILIPIHEEQKAIEKMVEYSEMGLSDDQICKSLTREGFMNREGKPFQKMTVYRILKRQKKNGQDSFQVPQQTPTLLPV